MSLIMEALCFVIGFFFFKVFLSIFAFKQKSAFLQHKIFFSFKTIMPLSSATENDRSSRAMNSRILFIMALVFSLLIQRKDRGCWFVASASFSFLLVGFFKLFSWMSD